jgi:hypothetical protein
MPIAHLKQMAIHVTSFPGVINNDPVSTEIYTISGAQERDVDIPIELQDGEQVNLQMCFTQQAEFTPKASRVVEKEAGSKACALGGLLRSERIP